jgi:hypothetical protein
MRERESGAGYAPAVEASTREPEQARADRTASAPEVAAAASRMADRRRTRSPPRRRASTRARRRRAHSRRRGQARRLSARRLQSACRAATDSPMFTNHAPPTLASDVDASLEAQKAPKGPPRAWIYEHQRPTTPPPPTSLPPPSRRSRGGAFCYG